MTSAGWNPKQIDLRVTAGWSGTEEDKCSREQEACDEKDVAELSAAAAIVDGAGKSEHDTAGRDALGKTREGKRVSHRVAKADHQRQSDATQQEQRRQHVLRAAGSANRPEDVHCREGAEEKNGPKDELIAKL